MKTLLVVGGCGDIGSHMVKCFPNISHDFSGEQRFASRARDGEYSADPTRAHESSMSRPPALMQTMKAYPTDPPAFSSTTAVFGESQAPPMDEAHPVPLTRYGQTRLMVERAPVDVDSALSG